MLEHILLAPVRLRCLPTQHLPRGFIVDAVPANASLLIHALLAAPIGFHLRAMVAVIHVGHGSSTYGGSHQGAKQQIKSALRQHVRSRVSGLVLATGITSAMVR